jgi:FtsZ-interacting cell division protein ZipA
MINIILTLIILILVVSGFYKINFRREYDDDKNKKTETTNKKTDDKTYDKKTEKTDIPGPRNVGGCNPPTSPSPHLDWSHNTVDSYYDLYDIDQQNIDRSEIDQVQRNLYNLKNYNVKDSSQVMSLDDKKKQSEKDEKIYEKLYY